jgi:hypothetical protein
MAPDASDCGPDAGGRSTKYPGTPAANRMRSPEVSHRELVEEPGEAENLSLRQRTRHPSFQGAYSAPGCRSPEGDAASVGSSLLYYGLMELERWAQKKLQCFEQDPESKHSITARQTKGGSNRGQEVPHTTLDSRLSDIPAHDTPLGDRWPGR